MPREVFSLGGASPSHSSGGIVQEHVSIEIEHHLGAGAFGAADYGVAMFHKAGLYPCHVKLGDGAPAPLARFEDDHAHGAAGAAVLLEHRHHAPLRAV